MPPYLDVYVWTSGSSHEVFRRFIDDYVNVDDPGDERFYAFWRVHVLRLASDADEQALAELRPDDEGGGGFSLYLNAREHAAAIVTVTRDGAAVLGLSLDDPDNSPKTLEQAGQLLARLREKFSAPAGIAGVELPPPQTRSQWSQDGLVQLRVGVLPPAEGTNSGALA
jgi:hypothetical protein